MRKMILISALFCGLAMGQSRYELLPAPGKIQGELTETSHSPLDIPVSVNVRGVALPYLLSLISQLAGVPIVLRDISYPASQSGGQPGQGQTQGQAQQTVGEFFPTSYYSDRKPLRQVMDELTGIFDLWWKYEDGRIVVYKWESRSYQLNLPFMLKKIDEKYGTSVQISYARDFMKGLEDSFKKLLKDKESSVSVNEMGFVFVSARPSEIRAIESAINKINQSFTKEIPLKVKTYLVRETDFMSFGLGLSFKHNNIGGSLNAGVSDPIFSVSILTSRVEAQLTALARDGKAQVIDESNLRALNGQPIFFAPNKKTRIVSKFNLSYVSSGGNSPPIPTIIVETEDLPTGYSLIIVPYYIGDEHVVVDVYRRQDNIDSIDYQTVDLSGFQNKIALPVLSQRVNLSQTVLRRGESVVLFTNAQSLEELRKSGIPFLKDIPILGYLFSQTTREKEKYRILVVISFEDFEKEGQK